MNINICKILKTLTTNIKRNCKNTFSDHPSEEELLLKDDVAPPRIESEDYVAPRIESEDDLDPGIGSADDVTSRIESEDELTLKIGSGDDVIQKVESEDAVTPSIESNVGVTAKLGSGDGVTAKLGSGDEVVPRTRSEDGVAPRNGSEDVASRIGSEDVVASRIGSEDGVASRFGSEDGVAPIIGSEDVVASRIGSEDGVASRFGSEDGVAPRTGSEDVVASRFGSEDGVASRFGSEDGVAPRIGSEDGVAPRIGSEDVVASRIGSEDGVAPIIGKNLIFDEMADGKTQQSGFCSRTKKRKKKYHLNQPTSRCLAEMANDKKRLRSSSFRTNKRKKTQHKDETIRCNEKSVNILLVGKAGSGKSTIGNMISGKKLFHVSSQAQLVTTECQIETVTRDGVEMTIVDSPGSFSLEMESSTVQAKIKKCLEDHPNMFPLICVLCVPAGVRFTKEDKAMINHIEENFGTCVLQNLMVVFTGNLPKISDVKNNPKWFKRFLDNIGNRTFHFKTDSSQREIQESSFIKACQMLLKKPEYLNYNFSDYQTAQRLI